MTDPQKEAYMPATEFEAKPKITVNLLGALKDLNLGNTTSGIIGELATANEAEKIRYGNKLGNAIRPVTDKFHLACIDGRTRLGNVDGSKPEVRKNQAGGTEILLETAMWGQAPILDSLDGTEDIGVVFNKLHEFYEAATDIKPSAHEDGCAAAKDAVKHGYNVAKNPAIKAAVGFFMSLPDVYAMTGLEFDEDVFKEVQQNAYETSQWLEANGWDGQKFVEGVAKDEPAGVEHLEVDHEDEVHHGHIEPAVDLIINKTNIDYALSDIVLNQEGTTPPFTVNVDESLRMARVLAGQGGKKAELRIFMANLAKHFALTDDLPDETSPVYMTVLE